MKSNLIDTNVIVRYFVEDPQKTPAKFKGVFSFFTKVETGETIVELPDLVVFEAFYVLTKIYKIAQQEVAEKLHVLVSFKGIVMHNKHFMLSCLQILQSKTISLVDAYILANSRKKGIHSVYSYDTDLSKHGLKLLEIK